jgi:transcriptional regulator, propionate catabolism operon regulatory protein
MALEPDLQALFAEFDRRASAGGERLTLRAWLDLAEAWRILEALRHCRGNRSAAARALGIGRRTLYTKMEKLGIEPNWGTLPGLPPRATDTA